MSSSTSETQNPQLRKDPIYNRWVIFSPARSKRPTDFKSKSPSNPNPNTTCPFCIGNEHQCAPEIFRVPPDDDPNWKIRVIQNLYPALSRNLVDPVDVSSGSVLDGFGFHDVVIETPVHSVQLCDLSKEEIGEVFVAYTRRIQQLVNRHSIKYVQIPGLREHNYQLSWHFGDLGAYYRVVNCGMQTIEQYGFTQIPQPYRHLKTLNQS